MTEGQPGQFFVTGAGEGDPDSGSLVHRISGGDLQGTSWDRESSDSAGCLAPGQLLGGTALLPVTRIESETDGSLTLSYAPGGGATWRPFREIYGGKETRSASTGSLLDLFAAIFSGAAYLHSRNHLHFNLRPGSLLLPGTSTSPDAARLLHAGMRFAPTALPVADLAFYAGDDGESPVASYIDFERYTARDDVRAARRLCLWLLDVTGRDEEECGIEGAEDETDPHRRDDRRARGDRLRRERDDLVQGLRFVLRTGGTESSGLDAAGWVDRIKSFRSLWNRTLERATRGELGLDHVRDQLRADHRIPLSWFPARPVPQVRAFVPGRIDNPFEPCSIRVLGTGLDANAIHYLRLETSTGEMDEDFFVGAEIPAGDLGGGCGSATDAIEKGLPVLVHDEGNRDTPTCLFRVLPPLNPGVYRVFSTSEGDTGHRLEVLAASGEAENDCRFDSVEPAVLEDFTRETVVTLRGRGLAGSGILHLERDGSLVVCNDGARYVRLRRVEGRPDTDEEIHRIVPPLSMPGVYHVQNEGQRTGLCFEAPVRPAVFTGLEPGAVDAGEAFELRVTGRFLPRMGEFELRDGSGEVATDLAGEPVRPVERPEDCSPDGVILDVACGVRPGVYELHCRGKETDLSLTVVSPVESCSPRRLHLRGRTPRLRLGGESFSPTSSFCLQAEKRNVEVAFEELELTDDGVELVLPRDTPADSYEVTIDGVATGSRVRVARFSRSMNALFSAMALLVLSLSGLAGIPYVFRTEFAELSPETVHFLETSGRVLNPRPLELFGTHLKKSEDFVLVSTASDDVRISLQPERTERDGQKLLFTPVHKLPLPPQPGIGSELELCVIDDDGEITRRTGMILRAEPFGASLEEIRGDGVRFDGVDHYRLEGKETEEVALRVVGQGLAALRRGTLDLEPPHCEVTLRELEDGKATLALDEPDRLENEVGYRLRFHPERGGDSITLGSIRFEEYVGFDGVRGREGQSWDRETSLFDDGGLITLRSASPATRERELLQFRLMGGSAALTGTLTPAERSGDTITVRVPPVEAGARPRTVDLQFRTSVDGPWKETGLDVRLCPSPTFLGFAGEGKEFLRDGVAGFSQEADRPARLRLYGTGLEPVSHVALTAATSPAEMSWSSALGGPETASVQPGSDDVGDYWELEIPAGATRSGRTFEVSYVSPITGETVSLDEVSITLYDEEAAEALADRIQRADRAFASGEVGACERILAELLDEPAAGDWSAAEIGRRASRNDRSRLMLLRFLLDWMVFGRRERARSGVESIASELYRQVAEAVMSAERATANGGARPRIECPDFSVATSTDLKDDWITPLVRGYEGYLDVVFNRRLDRRAEVEGSLDALEGRFFLAPFLAWDLRLYAAANRPGKETSLEELLADLDALTLAGDEEIVESHRLYYRCRGRVWNALRGGEESGLTGDLVAAAVRLEEANPALCAFLIAQVGSVDLIRFDREQSATLRDTFERVLPRLPREIATALMERMP